MQEEDNRKTIFVFYTINSNDFSLNIDNKIPTGWEWLGTGLTYPIYNTENWNGWLKQMYVNIFGPPTKYRSETQFIGPIETMENMKEYLNTKFYSLQERGMIKFYKIQETFHPVPI